MFHSTSHQAVIMQHQFVPQTFSLHFEPDSFLPDRLASIFLIPFIQLHCQNADNRLTFKSDYLNSLTVHLYSLIFINPF